MLRNYNLKVTAMDLKQVLEAGDLEGAIRETSERVKKSPTDAAARYLLAEMHSVNADWIRVDKHLDLIFRQEEKLIPQVTIYRQLLRAAKSREECFEQGRVPMFQQEPGPVLELHLKAFIALREKQLGEARELLERVETERQRLAGTVDGSAFDDLRDLDDLTSSFLELMTATGDYYWVSFASLVQIEFSPAQRLRDSVMAPGTRGQHQRARRQCLHSLPLPRQSLASRPLDSAGEEDGLAGRW